MSRTFLRRTFVALAAFTIACGDSTGPANLSQEEVADMLDALSSVASFAEIPGTGMSANLMAPVTGRANATATISQTVDCPNGGSASVNGTVTEDEAAGTMSAQVTQGFSSCRATSSEGRLWTFDGNPNIVTTISASYNETSGAFSMTATQAGGIRFGSDLGSGSCQINLTFTMSGSETSFTSTLNGSACGRSIQQSITITE